MSTAWSAWYDDVLPDVPGCSQPMADYRIKRAAVAFCLRSRAYRARGYVSDAGGLGARGVPASLVPTGTRLVSIESVKFSGVALLPLTPAQLDDLYADWTTQTASSPQYLLRDRPAVMANSFYLVPAPTGASTTSLMMEVSISPSESATTVDDAIFGEFREAIGMGAKGMLMAMQKKPWSDPQLAELNLSGFNGAIEVAKIKAIRGADRQKFVTKPYSF